MSDPFKSAAKAYREKRKYDPFAAASRAYKNIDPGFFAGLRGSAAGQLVGYEPEPLPEDASLLESLSQKAGTIAGDLPAMLAGGLIGGPIAGTAGAFAAPELVKQLAQYIRSPGSQSFGEAVGKLAHVPFETGKQALVGAATGGLGHLARLGKVLAPTSKLLSSKLGSEALASGAEVAGMTGAQSLLAGEMPTARDVAENILLLGAMKGISPAVKAIRKPLAKKVPILKEGALGKAAIKQASKIKPVQELFERYKKSKPFFEMVRKNVGEGNARIVENQIKWKKSLDKVKGKITPEQLEAGMYFAQKTGNPFVEGSTFESNAKKVGAPLRRIIENEIRPHMQESLKEINKQLYTKKVVPREELIEKYMPGMYENAEKFPSIESAVSKQMQFRNPFANPKTFLDYNEAWIKAGLKPRFKNIFDLVDAFDQVNAKNIAGSGLLVDISKYEKKTGDKIILTSRDPEYNLVKGKFKPYQDLTLRGYTREGKLVKPTIEPALVAPELSDAIQGVFSKEAYKPTNKFVQSLRNLSDIYRLGRVRLSFFHYVPLTESSAGSLGIRKAFNFRELANKGYELRADQAFMKDAARHGLIIHKPVERFARAMRMSEKLSDWARDAFPKTTKVMGSQYNVPVRALKRFAKSQNYMFEQYHPNLKAVTWQDFVTRALEKSTKEGKTLSDTQVSKIKSGMADLVNNMYGGQNWNVQRVFNSKKYRNWLRDVIAYPDWTTSAIRQAANAFAPGFKGEMSRKYWMKFGLNYFMAHGLLKFLSGTFKKTKDGWDIDPLKGWKEISDPDPLSWYKFPLPDIDMNIAGFKFNPGRDERGRRLYSHFGKQALEIKDWAYHPFSTYFGKANPLIQEAYKQLTGRTPGKEQAYTVRGKWVGGKFVPWDASRPGTAERAASRGLALAESFVPFSVRGLAQRGVAPFLATGGGAVPISLGSTPHKAKSSLEKAFRKKDYDTVNRIRLALRRNGYKPSTIRKVVNAARRSARS